MNSIPVFDPLLYSNYAVGQEANFVSMNPSEAIQFYDAEGKDRFGELAAKGQPSDLIPETLWEKYNEGFNYLEELDSLGFFTHSDLFPFFQLLRGLHFKEKKDIKAALYGLNRDEGTELDPKSVANLNAFYKDKVIFLEGMDILDIKPLVEMILKGFWVIPLANKGGAAHGTTLGKVGLSFHDIQHGFLSVPASTLLNSEYENAPEKLTWFLNNLNEEYQFHMKRSTPLEAKKLECKAFFALHEAFPFPFVHCPGALQNDIAYTLIYNLLDGINSQSEVFLLFVENEKIDLIKNFFKEKSYDQIETCFSGRNCQKILRENRWGRALLVYDKDSLEPLFYASTSTEEYNLDYFQEYVHLLENSGFDMTEFNPSKFSTNQEYIGALKKYIGDVTVEFWKQMLPGMPSIMPS